MITRQTSWASGRCAIRAPHGKAPGPHERVLHPSAAGATLHSQIGRVRSGGVWTAASLPRQGARSPRRRFGGRFGARRSVTATAPTRRLLLSAIGAVTTGMRESLQWAGRRHSAVADFTGDIAGLNPAGTIGAEDQQERIGRGAEGVQSALPLTSWRRRGSGLCRHPRWSCRNGMIRARRRHSTCSARKPALCDRAGIPSAPGCPAPCRH